MSTASVHARTPVTPAQLKERKHRGAPITLVMACDFPLALYAQQAGIDIVSVSDASARPGLGRESRLSVTVDEMLLHVRAVRPALSSSLLLAGLPFLSYTTPADALRTAGRLLAEGGAQAVEVEGGADTAPVVRALTAAGIAVVGHVGRTRALCARTGSGDATAQEPESAIDVIRDAMAIADAGACALVLECIPERIAAAITALVPVPTIGIGAGRHCDGQGLAAQDLLGLLETSTAVFVQRFAALGDEARKGLQAFKQSVETAAFPGVVHTLSIGDDALIEIVARLGGAGDGPSC